jgi:hypothetical protein
MHEVRKLWIPILLGVLLIAAMFGVAGAGRNNRPDAALGPTAYITVPAAAFNPCADGADWYNGGNYILNMSSSTAYFHAGPVLFPHSGTVQITQIVLVARDKNAGVNAEACATVCRNPFSGGEDRMGSVCSTGSADRLRKFTTTSISPARVNPKWHGCYVELQLRPGSDISVASVRIAYRPVL